ncbi:hypothetical protein HY489_06300 [Candidatus Woesearchaeota archaeon]|nr:hypothetical protein [Candidatus Woesearchaeota archaeon]
MERFAVLSILGIVVISLVAVLGELSLTGMQGFPVGLPSQFIPTVVGNQPQWHYDPQGGGRPSTAMPKGMTGPGPTSMERCQNGVDDDFDKKVDCDDPDCSVDLMCSGGCRIDRWNIKKAGSKVCMKGVRMVCERTSSGFGWVTRACLKGQKCYNGNCR